MKYAIFNLKFFNEKSFHAKRRSTNRGCQKDTQPHRQEHHGNVFVSKIPSLSALTDYATISSHRSFPPGMFVYFNRSLPEPSKEDGMKQDGRCRKQPSCPFETHFDDNLRDTVAHMRMIHGDVVSQKFEPGVHPKLPRAPRSSISSTKASYTSLMTIIGKWVSEAQILLIR